MPWARPATSSTCSAVRARRARPPAPRARCCSRRRSRLDPERARVAVGERPLDLVEQRRGAAVSTRMSSSTAPRSGAFSAIRSIIRTRRPCSWAGRPIFSAVRPTSSSVSAGALAVLACAPRCSARRGRARCGRACTRRSPASTARGTGALAVDLATGSAVYAHNANASLLPASNEKLALTYAALVVLGPSFRMRTEVLGEGHLAGRHRLARRPGPAGATATRLSTAPASPRSPATCAQPGSGA